MNEFRFKLPDWGCDGIDENAWGALPGACPYWLYRGGGPPPPKCWYWGAPYPGAAAALCCCCWNDGCPAGCDDWNKPTSDQLEIYYNHTQFQHTLLQVLGPQKLKKACK